LRNKLSQLGGCVGWLTKLSTKPKVEADLGKKTDKIKENLIKYENLLGTFVFGISR